MKKLTNRQADILQMIIVHINREGYPPTLSEIDKHFGIRSKNGVSDHLQALVRKGCIRRANKGARAITVLRFQNGMEARVGVMTLMKNEISMKEAEARKSRLGWWRWANVKQPYNRGVRVELIDLATLRPLTPIFMVDGRNYTEGEFLGWVGKMTREEAMEEIDV